MKLRTVLTLAVLSLLFSLAPAARAQSFDKQEGAWRIAFFGSYSMNASHSINNGFQTGAELRVSDHFAARMDSFKITAPDTTVILARTQYQTALSHFLKPNNYVNTRYILPFANFGIGNADSVGGSKFAYAVGAGADIQVNDNVKVRVIDMTYVRSRVFPGGGILLGNAANLHDALTQIATGVKLTF